MISNPQITTPSVVRLTLDEAEEAMLGAVGRCMSAQRLEWQRREADPKVFNYLDHIRGALGEMAVCHLFGLRWNAAIGDPHAKDAGPYQVRTTTVEDGHLIIQENEVTKDDPYILVTGDGRDFIVRGWMSGKGAKRFPEPTGKDWRTGEPRITYWVSQANLWPIEDLPPAPASFFRASKVGNFPTPIDTPDAPPPDTVYCPVCWHPDGVTPKGRIVGEHDPHKHGFQLARG